MDQCMGSYKILPSKVVKSVSSHTALTVDDTLTVLVNHSKAKAKDMPTWFNERLWFHLFVFGSRQGAKGRRLTQKVSTWDQSPALENSRGSRTLYRGVPEEEPVKNMKEKSRYHHGFGFCDQLFSHHVSFPMLLLGVGWGSVWCHWWWEQWSNLETQYFCQVRMFKNFSSHQVFIILDTHQFLSQSYSLPRLLSVSVLSSVLIIFRYDYAMPHSDTNV